jgi:polyphenol oxidase
VTIAAVRFVEASSLAALPGLRHGFFGRQGGVSEGPFATLAAGLRSGDDPARVAENRARAARALGFPPGALAAARQVHGTACVTVREPWPADLAPDADALATDRPGVLLGVLSADCAPILLADPRARVVAAAHAGWRGALAGVAESAVAAMAALGAEPSRTVAAVGPCIAQPSYEVGPDLAGAVLAEDPAAADLFLPVPGSDRRLFDLKAYVARRLARAGVTRVEALAHDTCAEEGLFFSNRRAFRRGEGRFGVQLSAIGLPA